MHQVNGSSSFAELLSQSISATGMTLREVTDRLADEGFATTTATLSYWRNGRSVPFRKASKFVVTALETVLNLAPNTLTHALEMDLATAHKSMASLPVPLPQNSDESTQNMFGELDALTDWEGEVIREVLEEEIIVSADFRHIERRITILARITGKSSPTLHVSNSWESPTELDSPNDIGVYNIEGANIGETIETFHEGTISKTTTLLLPDYVPVGELHRVYYEHRYRATEAPFSIAGKRAFSWPLRFYTCRVIFLGELPSNIEWVLSRTAYYGQTREKTLVSHVLRPVNATVQASEENLENAIAYFRWKL